MKIKILTLTMLITLCLILTIGYASAASLSATLIGTHDGSSVVSEPQGTTIQLQYSFTIDPLTNAVGTLSYKYSADGINWGTKTTLTTVPNWDGSLKITDFTLNKVGYYRFYLNVFIDEDTNTNVNFPSSGSFYSDVPTPSVLPEAPPLAVFALGFAAMGLFIVTTKKRSKQS